MGFRGRILLRLRPAVVLPVVVPAAVITVAVLVARVSDALSVPVVLVAAPVAVMALGRMVLRFRRGARNADAGLGRRGDAAPARPLGGRQSGQRRTGEGRRRGCSRRRALARPERRHPAAWRSLKRRRDDGGDLAAPGWRSRNGGIAPGRLQEVRRREYEANRGQDGQQAEHGCGYARKTTPHNCPIGAPAPCPEF
jgi:hypothetical protein